MLCFKMSITSMDSLSLGWERTIYGRTASLLVQSPRRVWLDNCLDYKFSLLALTTHEALDSSTRLQLLCTQLSGKQPLLYSAT